MYMKHYDFFILRSPATWEAGCFAREAWRTSSPKHDIMAESSIEPRNVAGRFTKDGQTEGRPKNYPIWHLNWSPPSPAYPPAVSHAQFSLLARMWQIIRSQAAEGTNQFKLQPGKRTGIKKCKFKYSQGKGSDRSFLCGSATFQQVRRVIEDRQSSTIPLPKNIFGSKAVLRPRLAIAYRRYSTRNQVPFGSHL